MDLKDTVRQEHRFLIIGRCKNPKCGALRAQIIGYDKNLGKFVTTTIRSKDVKKTIEEIKKNPLYEIKSQMQSQGTESNQHWIYGKTISRREGKKTYIEYWACNFNGEKTLVERKLQNESTDSTIISN